MTTTDHTTTPAITLAPRTATHHHIGGYGQQTAPMTPLAKATGTVRFSTDGQYRYVKAGRWVQVQYLPTSEWLYETADTVGLGHPGMTAARRFTAELDAQADADAQGFDDDPNCPCIEGRCACGTDSYDPID